MEHSLHFKLCHFNSQPHKEADGTSPKKHTLFDCISTHSLTRRLTAQQFFICPLVFISTHSLTRRLTWKSLAESMNGKNFNSQPHKEADYGIFHWLTGGSYFNSQPHKEADSIYQHLKM